MLLSLLIGLLAGAAFSCLLTWLAMQAAPKLRFLDRPGSEAHKQQARAVPYGGGPAFLIALALAVPLAWWVFQARPIMFEIAPSDHGPWWPIAVAAAGLLVAGLLDDRKPMRASVKLICQILCCAVAVGFGDLTIDSLKPWPVVAMAVSMLWLVAVTNAFNLIDHADGMAAGCALISAGILLSGALMAGDPWMSLLLASLIGTLAGYLWWNRPPARIYLGDAGSQPLGFLIGVATLGITFWPSGEQDVHPLALLSPLLVVAVPAFDAAVVVIKRLRRGKPIMQGDRNHISHRLVRLGLSPWATLLTVLALHTALAAGALQLRSGTWLSGVLVLLQAAAILLAVVLLETSRDHGAD